MPPIRLRWMLSRNRNAKGRAKPNSGGMKHKAHAAQAAVPESCVRSAMRGLSAAAANARCLRP